MNTAVIFPGQGSQTVGMLGEFADHASVQSLFATASDVLGYDLFELVQRDAQEKLNETQYTQPALLATCVAFWTIYQEQKPNVTVVAGHSLGEYTALVAANALSFPDAIRLVARRGYLMQQAVPAGKGAMAAILGLDDEKVIEACAAANQNDVVEAVNFNAPGQVVIAGEVNAVNRAIEFAKQLGAKRAIALPVSVPSHCKLMRDAANELAKDLANINMQAPTISVVNNVDATVEQDPKAIKDALIRQLYNPVRWVDVVNVLANRGVAQFVECGPGKVLSGLNKRIISDIPCDSFKSFMSVAQ